MPGGNVVGMPGKPKGQPGGRGGPLVFALYLKFPKQPLKKEKKS
jgi:hypothetical protein